MARNVISPGCFPCAGSLELACHIVLGYDDLFLGEGGDGCQEREREREREKERERGGARAGTRMRENSRVTNARERKCDREQM